MSVSSQQTQQGGWRVNSHCSGFKVCLQSLLSSLTMAGTESGYCLKKRHMKQEGWKKETKVIVKVRFNNTE